MPISAVLCPACGKQPTDHFELGPCPLSPSERNWYGWTINHELADNLHADGHITPTRLLTCPRKTLLEDYTPYTLNPLWHNSTAVGTKIHEATSRSPLRLKGKLWGLDIEGECDNYEQLPDGTWWIDDTKSHGDNTASRILSDPNGPSDEYKVQFGIYAILFEQQTEDMGEKCVVTRLTASHFSPLYRYSEYFEFKVVEVPIMGEDWIGNVRPLGNPFTVKQLAGFYQNALAAIKEIGLKFNKLAANSTGFKVADIDLGVGEAIASCVPKVGAEMLKQKSGSWLCSHCPVKDLCDSLG